jgi:hypothetical protein
MLVYFFSSVAGLLTLRVNFESVAQQVYEPHVVCVSDI